MKIYNHVDKAILKEIEEVLDNDGLIIFPTDTVYGLACNAFSDQALQKLFLVKNRSYTKPINVLVDSVSKIHLVAKELSSLEKELIRRYLPGNLTIILNKRKEVSDILTANKNTIGVRIPNHKIALQILKSYPYPLATTSVNQSGEAPCENLEDILNIFQDKVDIIIDGGQCSNLPSTIVRVDNNKMNILREGSLKLK